MMDTGKRKSKKRSADSSDLTQIIKYFRKCERTTVRGNVQLALNLEKLEEVSTSVGLEPDHITQLLDIAAAGSWPQTVSKKLIQCLIPCHHVPSEAAVKAVSWMCTNKPAPAIQAFLLRWLVLVYELVDVKEDLHALYGFIFYFLENETMCPHVCHLLYLMTRKEDVRPVRIRALINLQQRLGAQASLQGLMAIYKLYCPHLVAIALPSTRTVFFRQTDRVWNGKIRAVQNRRKEDDEDHTLAMASRLHSSLTVSGSLSQVAKRRRKLIIPKAQESTQSAKRPFTYSAPLVEDDCTLPVSQVDSFKMFINNVHLLELPSRAASALENEFVCRLASLSGDRALPYRLSYWIHNALQEEFFHRPRSENLEDRQLLLDSLLYFTKFMQESIPVVESFLSQYLHVWNGQDHKTTLLKLVAHLNICPFKALSALILQPLHKLFFSSSVYFKCQVIWMLTELLRHQLLVDRPRHEHTQHLEAERITREDSYTANFHSMFRNEVEQFSGLKTISEVMSFVDQLVGVSLPLERDHVLFLHCCLGFYEMCISVVSRLDIPLIHVTPYALVYHCLFANNALLLSRLCSLFARYRSPLGSLRVRQRSETLQGELLVACETSRSHISRFNQYTLDIAAALWQGQALLGRSRPESVYQLFTEKELAEKADNTAKVAFTVYKHPGLLVYARRFASDPEMGDISDLAELKNKRKVYLEFLASHNIIGVSVFIEKFVRDKTSSSASASQLSQTTD